jgi:hypothetical protein
MTNPYLNLTVEELTALRRIYAKSVRTLTPKEGEKLPPESHSAFDDAKQRLTWIDEALTVRSPKYKGGTMKAEEVNLIAESIEGLMTFIKGLDESGDAGNLGSATADCMVKSDRAMKMLERLRVAHAP